jgi:hypothetical protein
MSALVRGLREEGAQDLFDVATLALGARRSLASVLSQGLDSVEHMVTVAAAIFVGRHTGSPLSTPGAGSRSPLCISSVIPNYDGGAATSTVQAEVALRRSA